MGSVFLPKDQLLASSGIFPVYYWFIRSRKEEEYPYIREFLVDFERKRRINRNIIQNEPKSMNIDKGLLEYDRLNRSTSDLKSHKGRVKFLDERFITYYQDKISKIDEHIRKTRFTTISRNY